MFQGHKRALIDISRADTDLHRPKFRNELTKVEQCMNCMLRLQTANLTLPRATRLLRLSFGVIAIKAGLFPMRFLAFAFLACGQEGAVLPCSSQVGYENSAETVQNGCRLQKLGV